jgi:hypothetical protein
MLGRTGEAKPIQALIPQSTGASILQAYRVELCIHSRKKKDDILVAKL